MVKRSEDIIKRKMIRRILAHTFVFKEQDLNKLSIRQLRKIQKGLLIEIIVKQNYKNRHQNPPFN